MQRIGGGQHRGQWSGSQVLPSNSKPGTQLWIPTSYLLSEVTGVPLKSWPEAWDLKHCLVGVSKGTAGLVHGAKFVQKGPRTGLRAPPAVSSQVCGPRGSAERGWVGWGDGDGLVWGSGCYSSWAAKESGVQMGGSVWLWDSPPPHIGPCPGQSQWSPHASSEWKKSGEKSVFGCNKYQEKDPVPGGFSELRPLKGKLEVTSLGVHCTDMCPGSGRLYLALFHR